MPACAVCGTACRPPFRPPPPEQAPDLDGRPGEPARSTLPRWTATCRTCGASAPDLSRLPRDAAAAVGSAAYRALAGPGPERAFLRQAALAEAGGEADEAAWALLHAAWLRDDAGQDAAPLRLQAAALWGTGDTVADGLRVLDVLRRAGAMQAADTQAARLESGPLMDSDAALLRFQRGLIDSGDTGRHLVSSALRPPARTPHVTHGRAAAPARRSIWHRLLGR